MKRPIYHSMWILIPAVSVLWTLFGLVMFALGGAAAYSKGYKSYDIVFNLVWHSNWLLWIPGTFIAFLLARKFPVEKANIAKGLLIQGGLGLLFVIAMGVFEYLINFPLRAMAGIDPIPLDYIVTFIGYKGPFNLAIYFGHVLAINGYDIYTQFRSSQLRASRLESKLHQAELQTLKMQLQPHFLFNTHNSIMALMMKGDNKGARKMLMQLSDLLRLTLEKTNQQCSSVREEVETLELYLGIQEVRFQDSLDIELHVDPECLSAKVPYLLLQPVVENAFKYALEGNSEKRGILEIRISKSATQLQLLVKDNGPGFDVGAALQSAKGLGLRMTRTRLEHIYAYRHNFKITSSKSTGTEVLIEVPFELADQ
jgi:two-component system LytT family sensor kinase